VSAAPFLFQEKERQMNNRIDAIYARQLVDKKDSISIESQIEFCKYELKGGNCKEYTDKGFEPIGFDSCCYSNRDLERKEVRINMGYFLEPDMSEDLAKKREEI